MGKISPIKARLQGKVTRDMFGVDTDLPEMLQLDLGKLDPNPDQPRKHFDQAFLEELAESIKEKGLIQPIVVKRLTGGRFMIVAGERRYRAHKLIGADTIRAIATDGNPDEIALIENVQRQDLDPIEEAEAYARLLERHQYSQRDLGRIVGKAESTISEILSLNALPLAIKEELRTSEVIRPAKSVLIEIARLPDSDKQLSLWQELKAGKATVKAARERKKRPTPEQLTSYQRVLGAIQRLRRELESSEELSEDQRAQIAKLVEDCHRRVQVKRN